MQEELIKFETVKLAKEKGFNWKVDRYFRVSISPELEVSRPLLDSETYFPNVKESYASPPQSLLQKWLREVNKLHLYVEYSQDHNKFAVGGWDEYHWRELSKRPRVEGRYPYPYKSEFIRKCWVYSTYEETLEIGLVEALKLIKNEKN